MRFDLNLASRRYVNKRALNHGFIAALVLLLLFGGWSTNNLFEQNSVLRQNLQHLSEVKQQLQGLRGAPSEPLSPAERADLEKEYKVIQDLLVQDRFRWTELLDRMEILLPGGVSLKSFRPDFAKDSLELGGQARSLKDMRKFLDRLMKKGKFKQVLLKNHARIKVKDYADVEREAISFSIQLLGVF